MGKESEEDKSAHVQDWKKAADGQRAYHVSSRVITPLEHKLVCAWWSQV